MNCYLKKNYSKKNYLSKMNSVKISVKKLTVKNIIIFSSVRSYMSLQRSHYVCKHARNSYARL